VEQDVWDWTFYSVEEVQTALEDYDALIHDQAVLGDGGDQIGDPQRKDRLYRLMARNRLIDQGMRTLAWDDRPAWRVIRLYYLQGSWSERWGWLAAARAAGLDIPVCLRGVYSCAIPGDHRGGERKPKTCPQGDRCVRGYERFNQEVLPRAIRCLAVHIGDAQGVPVRCEG
jgi:hypothetical protein